MTPPYEQRNPYKGSPERPWLQVRFLALDGSHHQLQLIADTGCPYFLIIGTTAMSNMMWRQMADIHTNYGTLEGGWLHVEMPELGLNRGLLGYSNDAVRSAAQRSCSDFEGLVGLSFLRLLEYGGDPNEFWVRPLSPPTP